MSDSKTIKNFHEYFTTHVNELNKKEIVKSVIDGQSLSRLEQYQYRAGAIRVCDGEPDCFQVISEQDTVQYLRRCNYCGKFRCSECDEKTEFTQSVCFACKRVSCATPSTGCPDFHGCKTPDSDNCSMVYCEQCIKHPHLDHMLGI